MNTLLKYKKIMQEKFLKNHILESVKKYYQAKWGSRNKLFIPGKCKINYSGRVFNEQELINLIDSSLEFWLTEGKWTKKFEEKFCNFLGVKNTILLNSGSSANLIAFNTLTSHRLGDRRVKGGDEIITTSVNFPTTITPIIQYGAIPVFMDINIDTLNINISNLYKGLSEKTKAIFVANTLGNPVNIDALNYFCKENNLWLIIDSCDSLGSTYKEKHLDQYADLSTHSFFPAHGISCGQGGAVCTNNSLLNSVMKSFSKWGREYDCKNCGGNCANRFKRKTKNLPEGYDCKYIFKELGYNLVATDLQASILCAQIDKLSEFIEKRKQNWNKLYEGLKDLSNYFIFQKAEKKSDPCWFGFAITLQDNIPFKRVDLIKFLENKNIETRLLFAGDIVSQPCFEYLKNEVDYKIIGNMSNTDKVMKNSFFIGVYPGMLDEQLSYIIESIRNFVLKYGG